ncbi:MAG TPA: DNA-processing protein DprA [Steroidobacteraceae bacterium]|nr:DNA-processing protein DprA [Steroidobacteraceae bacterium]
MWDPTSDWDDLLAWAALVRAPGLDVAAVAAALDLLGRPAAIITASDTLRSRAAIPAVTRAFLSSSAAIPAAAERAWLGSAHHYLIPFTDPRYPQLLLSLPDCPIALYVSGRVETLADPQLAIVGSRCPTPQGRETARAFAEYLGERGLVITSGLAEGIDACAHYGALQAQGVTLGVLGTGMDIVYPRCNQRLCEDIERQGALVSEFPLGTPPRRGNFPRRNRIIAALSLGTLVVEAALRSGSLITARLANSYGREVFAIPGSIHNPLSRGCHQLIKAGAKLAETADDILRELNFSTFFANDLHARDEALPRPRHASGMDKDHKILLDALGFDPVDLDTLVVRTGFKPEAVSSMMLILELEGHVQAAPGGRYSRVAYRRAGGER